MSEIRFPNESEAYRAARQDLLKLEAELRTKVEEVAAARRALPLGGAAKEDYLFDSADGPVKLSELFAEGKDTLFLYGFMYGPNMKKACPLCTSFLDSLDANVRHLAQRINVAVVALSPLERIQEHATARGWTSLRLLSSQGNTYQADYLAQTAEGNQMPMANVFVKRGGAVHHTWGSEMLYHRDGSPGDSRHIDMIWPVWNVFDMTPEGRGAWYPSLSYEG